MYIVLRVYAEIRISYSHVAEIVIKFRGLQMFFCLQAESVFNFLLKGHTIPPPLPPQNLIVVILHVLPNYVLIKQVT